MLFFVPVKVGFGVEGIHHLTGVLDRKNFVIERVKGRARQIVIFYYMVIPHVQIKDLE